VPLHQGFIDLLRSVPFFIGRTEDQIVGSGFLDIVRARVEGMFVRPAFARRGIAKSILQLIEDAALAEGLPHLALDATLNAAPFYERQGYAILSPGTWSHPAGFDIACIHMRKKL
jgi:GNAT superfamily N-acetyltransferase